LALLTEPLAEPLLLIELPLPWLFMPGEAGMEPTLRRLQKGEVRVRCECVCVCVEGSRELSLLSPGQSPAPVLRR
jgi:hypothetical protein